MGSLQDGPKTRTPGSSAVPTSANTIVCWIDQAVDTLVRIMYARNTLLPIDLSLRPPARERQKPIAG
ncbi:hypothetical protein VTL71DRAFT_12885 [Oculimacula yallundae]|uniref:Uncharacterized protein n=1 Tax=Oculimacula yallundae TaxID=86028 RepID=A0ABR4CP88_9HELO